MFCSFSRWAKLLLTRSGVTPQHERNFYDFGASLCRRTGKINAYWHAANYLSVGQIYLYDNPLLQEPLKLEHVKPRLLGHWGTTPGLNFIYAHLNRVIKKYDLNMIYIAGPGTAGRVWSRTPTWKEPTASSIHNSAK